MALEKNALLTAEDYQSLPDGGPRYELIQGELRMAPAPNLYHQKISCNLVYLLRQHLERAGGGEIFHSPVDVYLSDHDVVQPDLVFVHTSRLGILAPEGIQGAPTLVVEILSPSTAGVDRKAKKSLYSGAGVQELWLVDPDSKQVEIYHLQSDPDAPSRCLGQDQRLTSDCLPGLELDCRAVFK